MKHNYSCLVFAFFRRRRCAGFRPFVRDHHTDFQGEDRHDVFCWSAGRGGQVVELLLQRSRGDPNVESLGYVRIVKVSPAVGEQGLYHVLKRCQVLLALGCVEFARRGKSLTLFKHA